MTSKFTPELFVEFPRRSPAIPNADGSFALYTVSTYSIDAKAETKETKYLVLKTNEHHLFSDDPDVTSAQWLKKDLVIWHKSKDGGATQLFIGTVGEANKQKYLAATIEAPISNIKTKELANSVIALAFCAPVKPDGTMFNPESEPKPASSAREFETINIRYWDKWTKPYRSALFFTTLRQKPGQDAYKLSEAPPVNILKNTHLQFPYVDGPFGEGGSYDLSKKGILFTAVDPEVNSAQRCTQELWVVPLETFEETAPPKPLRIDTTPMGCTGSAEAPTFNFDGTKFAFLKSKDWRRDWWAPRELLIASTEDPTRPKRISLADPVDQTKAWDRSPDDIVWSVDGSKIFITAQDNARRCLYSVDVRDALTPHSAAWAPQRLTSEGTLMSTVCMSDDAKDHRVLVTMASMFDSSEFRVIDSVSGDYETLSSLTENGALFGASKTQIDEFWLTSKDGKYKFQSWILTPPNFDKNKKYPVDLFIHGGPQVAWMNQWSHRWSPALFAAQGYVVVIPNFTGSSSFGEKFADDIACDWGGRPYDDVVTCFEHVKNNIPYADTTRAVASGASYGGYMMNWIAGQPLSKELKALVNHNGVFNMPGMLASDTAWEVHLDLGGQYWESKDIWDRNDPSLHCANWNTPMLFIHSDNDFRCTLDQGIAPYMVCQQRGIPTRFLNFPDENHFVQKRENQLHWYRTIIGWKNKWVGMKGEDAIKLAPPLNEPVRTDVETA